MKLTPKNIRNFWKKVRKGAPGECWEWIGSKDENGYGCFGIKRKIYRSHRISFLLYNGKLPKNCCCHKCDNPSCINPEHLFDGTHKENIQDCSLKGRAKRAMGEASGKTILTEFEILQIRHWLSIGMTERECATGFKVCHATIGNIKHKRTWNN